MNKNLCVIKAPSNLGLHPPAPGREPGAWRAPEALVEAGLYAKLQPVVVWDLPRPIYDFEPQAGTRLRTVSATDCGAWPVRCSWKALAAWAICRAIVGRELVIVHISDCRQRSVSSNPGGIKQKNRRG